MLRVMVHPQHIDANLGASWQLEATEFSILTGLSDLHCQHQIKQETPDKSGVNGNAMGQNTVGHAAAFQVLTVHTLEHSTTMTRRHVD